MAGYTHIGTTVRHYKKIPVLIVVRIVAGRALKLVPSAKLKLDGKRRRRPYLRILCRKRDRIDKTYWMIVR
jgi:hypothetical protein